jgi:anaerobic selenocysteine-containing dehydrogenase
MRGKTHLSISSERSTHVTQDTACAEIKKTFCGICSSGCAVDAYVKEGRLIKVKGTGENPVTKGLLCGKGRTNLKYVYHQERVRTPLLRKGEKGSDDFIPISWDEALDRIADKLLKIKKEFGPESVVFFQGIHRELVCGF